jgi:Mg2+-importing ATPase
MVTDTLGFVPLSPLYWLYLAIMLLGYALLTQVVKTWFIRIYRIKTQPLRWLKDRN